MMQNDENKTHDDVTDNSCDQSRRDAMKKIGKYAAYTAPAMLTLLSSKSAIAGSPLD
jgi:hypothetical protein